MASSIKCQCWPHIETSQLIWTANQLTGFYMRAPLAFNGLTVHKLSEHGFWQNWVNFCDKMDLPIRMTIIYNKIHPDAICLKIGGNFLTSLTNRVLKVKASICSTIKENLLLHCCKFSVFVSIVTIQHVFKTRSASQRNTSCNRNHEICK